MTEKCLSFLWVAKSYILLLILGLLPTFIIKENAKFHLENMNIIIKIFFLTQHHRMPKLISRAKGNHRIKVKNS